MTHIISVKQGKLMGETCKGVLGTSYISFKGIPYAAPPIGDLRFEDPQPPLPWTGVRDAGNIKVNICVQVDEYPPYQVIGDEDSLYLNVYTPSLSGVRPVMVYIHGGIFITGSGTDMHIQPDYLMDKDIVFVTINYRLGVLGFLSLDDEAASGNQGLKDQVAALKWVQENIANFGGDANNVTLLGSSAGGACVHYLMLSDMAKGLFHKAICHSGVANCPWAQVKNQLPEYCLKLASYLGCNSKNPKEIVKFLRTLPASKLVNNQYAVIQSAEVALFKLPFGPCLDPKSKNPFLPRPIIELSNNSNIPMLLGCTDKEFILFFKDPRDGYLKNMDKILKQHVGTFMSSLSPEKLDNAMKDIRQLYFDNQPLNKELIPSFLSLMGSIYFICPVYNVADKRRKQTCAPTYLYQFSYIGNELTTFELKSKHFFKCSNFGYVTNGATHLDELSYLLYLTRNKVNNPDPPKKGSNDRIMLERMTRLWSDFVKTGNPTPPDMLDEYVDVVWKPVTKDSFTYFQIDKQLKNCTVQSTLQEIYDKYS